MSIQDQLRVITSTSGASYTSTDKRIPEGRLTTRLQLGNDPRFYIAAKIVPHSKRLTKKYSWASIKHGDQTILLNINSICTRLHLTREQVRRDEQAGTLPTQLIAAAKRTEIVLLVPSTLEKIKHYFKTKKIPITPALISYVKNIATDLIRGNDGSELLSLPIPGLKPHMYSLSYDPAQKKIELIYMAKTLGSGSAGIVRSYVNVLDLTKGTRPEIIKLSRNHPHKSKSLAYDWGKQYRNATQECLSQEYRVLCAIENHYDFGLNKNGKKFPRLGLQTGPTRFLYCYVHGDFLQTKRLGFCTERYGSNYTKLLKEGPRPLDIIYMEIYQLLAGLWQLHDDVGIIHGDLKPDNVFCDEQDHFNRLVIGDFGGTVPLNEEGLSIKKIQDRTYNIAYSCLQDREILNKMTDGEDRLSDAIELGKGSDVFAMGMILYNALSFNQNPFKRDKNKDNIPSTYQPLLMEGIEPRISDLIQRMLSENFEERPSARQALETLYSILQEINPKLIKIIEDKQFEANFAK